MSKITIKAIQKAVAEQFGMSIAELKEKNNARDLVAARQMAMYLARTLTGASLPEIARSFGGRHHTTVIYAVRRVLERSQSDRNLRIALAKLQNTLKDQETADHPEPK